MRKFGVKRTQFVGIVVATVGIGFGAIAKDQDATAEARPGIQKTIDQVNAFLKG